MSNKQNTPEIASVQAQTSTGNPTEIIYLGLDLGTSQSAIATSAGLKLNVASIVGWPKDLIGYQRIEKLEK